MTLARCEDHWTSVDGHRTRYWALGDAGPPVLLLHGIGCSVLEWNRCLPMLAARHRVFALDLLGSGASAKPPQERYDLPRLADFVLAFLRQQGLGPVHLGGNSLGGRLALECAMRDPAALRSLLLVDPAGVGRETFLNFRLATLPGLGELLTRPSRAGLTMLWSLAFHDRRKIEPQRIDQKLADAREAGAQQAFLRTLRSFVGLRGFLPGPLAQLRAALPTLTQPTAIVWGRQDRLLPVAQGEALSRAMPAARLHVLDGCGHLPQLEQPEAFARLALDFWAEVDAPVRPTAAPPR